MKYVLALLLLFFALPQARATDLVVVKPVNFYVGNDVSGGPKINAIINMRQATGGFVGGFKAEVIGPDGFVRSYPIHMEVHDDGTRRPEMVRVTSDGVRSLVDFFPAGDTKPYLPGDYMLMLSVFGEDGRVVVVTQAQFHVNEADAKHVAGNQGVYYNWNGAGYLDILSAH